MGDKSTGGGVGGGLALVRRGGGSSSSEEVSPCVRIRFILCWESALVPVVWCCTGEAIGCVCDCVSGGWVGTADVTARAAARVAVSDRGVNSSENLST